MFKFNTQGIPDSRQCPIDGVKEVVATCIILRSDPFSFHYSPQGFCKIQVRGIRWKVKEKKSAFLPQFSQFLYFLVSMYARIVKHDERIFLYVQGKGVKVFNDLVRVNTFSRGEPMIAVVPVYHAEDVDPLCLLGWDIHVFVTELPAVRHIAFGAHMAFIGVIEVYLAVYVQMFKFLQLLGLIRIELRRGLTLRTFSYTSISCANADKKRLNVDSLASLPEAFCQASLAARTLCRSDSMALRTASSSEQSMMALRPCPGRVYNPWIPWFSKRLTQLPTVWAVISVCAPTWGALKPSALSNMARQRIRKQWLSPVRKPVVSSRRSESLNVNFLIFICLAVWFETKIMQFRHM